MKPKCPKITKAERAARIKAIKVAVKKFETAAREDNPDEMMAFSDLLWAESRELALRIEEKYG